jgi:type I restriction enzyme S subunit
MTRLRYLAEVNPPTPEFDDLPADAEVPFLPLEAVWPGERLDVSRRRPKREVSNGYTRFREGDILVPKITPTFEADRTVLVRGLEGGIAAGTTELHIVRPRPGVEPRFLRYILSSRPFLLGGEASMIGVAGQKRVPEDWLKDFPVQITEPCIQLAIADYLDAETARIDALIAKLGGDKTSPPDSLTGLLLEKRQALITAAVTGELAVPGAVA